MAAARQTAHFSNHTTKGSIMKKHLLCTAVLLALTACANTMQGAKEDTARNVERTGEGIERGWDKTKDAVRKGGNAVGRGISHVGEKIENATE